MNELDSCCNPCLIAALLVLQAISRYKGLGLEPSSASPDTAASATSDEDADIDPELAHALRSFEAPPESPSSFDEYPLRRAAFELQGNAAQQTTPAGGPGIALLALGFRTAAGTAGLTEGIGTAVHAGLASTTMPAWTGLDMPGIAQPHGRLVTSGMPSSIGSLRGFNSARTVPPAPTMPAPTMPQPVRHPQHQ